MNRNSKVDIVKGSPCNHILDRKQLSFFPKRFKVSHKENILFLFRISVSSGMVPIVYFLWGLIGDCPQSLPKIETGPPVVSLRLCCVGDSPGSHPIFPSPSSFWCPFQVVFVFPEQRTKLNYEVLKGSVIQSSLSTRSRFTVKIFSILLILNVYTPLKS